jgi:hypothetical protein
LVEIGLPRQPCRTELNEGDTHEKMLASEIKLIIPHFSLLLKQEYGTSFSTPVGAVSGPRGGELVLGVSSDLACTDI